MRSQQSSGAWQAPWSAFPQPCLGLTSSLQAALRDAFMQRLKTLLMAEGSGDAP